MRLTERRHAAACGALAAAAAAVFVWVGPSAGDQAAHFYGRRVFLDEGLSLWDNFWYSGHPSFVTYSLVYYPLAGWLGTFALALACVAVASFAYTRVMVGQWGNAALMSAYAFALVWGATVAAGAYPFLLGAALGLLALLAAQRGSAWQFALLSALTMAANPVAFVLLGVLATAIVLASSGLGFRLRRPPAVMIWIAATLAFVTFAELVVWRVFRSGGRYPYGRADLVYALAFSLAGVALSFRLERARTLFVLFTVYGVAALASFALPSPLGANIARLRLAALPIGLIVLTLRAWRPLVACAPALLFVGWWTLQPIIGVLTHTEAERSSRRSYWQPAVTFLKANMSRDYRSHVVDTVGHWGAAYLPAAGIPIARGWFRQHDYPRNALFYDETLPADRYLAWLRASGVGYVVLSNTPPDYSSRREAGLLRSGRSGLAVAARFTDLTVFSVPSPVALVTGPGAARVRAFSRSSVTVDLGAPGAYVVSLRQSPHWQPSRGCLLAGPGQGMTLKVSRPGTVLLDFRVTRRSIARALSGRESVHDSGCDR